MGEFKEKVFLKEFVDWSAQKFDDAFFKKGWPEIVDKLAMKGVLNIINGALSDDIRDDIKPKLWDAQRMIIDGNYDDGGVQAIDALIIVIETSSIKDKAKYVIMFALSLVRSVVDGLD